MNRPINLYLILIISLLISCLFTISPINAQNKTIIVPDDCLTIASAINNAVKGDTIFIRNGVYEGPINDTLIIDKSISLIGESTANTIINLHPKYNVTWLFSAAFYDYSDALQINANDVTIANLSLKFIGNMRANGDRIQIIDSDIWSHSTSTGLYIKGTQCTIFDNKFLGVIELTGFSNLVDKNTAYNLRLQDAHNTFVSSNTLQVLSLINSTSNIITQNTINTENAIYVTYLVNSSSNLFYNNHIKSALWNTNLMITYQSINNTFYGNAFVSRENNEYIDLFTNQNLAVLDSTSHSNIWSNNSIGNFWHNYQKRYPNASEVGTSRVGNIPYVIDENNTDNYPLTIIKLNLPSLSNPMPLPTPSIIPLPTIAPTKLYTSTPTTTSSLSPTPTQSPIPTQSASPTQTSPSTSPTSLPSITQNLLPSKHPQNSPLTIIQKWIVWIILIIVSVVIAGFVIFRKKTKLVFKAT